MREIAFGIVAVFLLFTVSLTGASAQSANTCGINFVSGNSVTYGNLQSGATSSEQTITLSNPGTVAATLSVNGTNWVDGSQTTVINVGNTKFANSTGTYSAKTPLTLTLQNIGTLQPSVNTNTYWQLQANLLNTAFTGNLTQALNFRVSCDGSSGGSQTSPTFTDNFTYATQAAADAVWVPNDNTKNRVNIGSQELGFNLVIDNTNDAISYDLGSGGVSDTDFVLRFKLRYTSLTASNNNVLIFGLSSTDYSNHYGSTQDGIACWQWYAASDKKFKTGDIDNTNWSLVHLGTSAGPDIIANTDYFFELVRSNATTTSCRMYSDMGYSSLLGSSTTTVTGNPTGLRYLKLVNVITSESGNFQGSLDNVTFWNGVSQVPNSSGQTTVSYPDGLGSVADGTVQGSITQGITGLIGKTSQFNGDGRYANGKSALENVGSGDFTVSYWIKNTSTSTANIVGSYLNGNWQMSVNPAGASIWSPSAALGVNGLSLNDNNWHYIVLTRSAGTLKIYVDNVIRNSGTWTSSLDNQVTSIGADTGEYQGDFYPEGHVGYLDELSTWKRALSESEISTLYNSGAGRTANSLSDLSGLLTYFNFDETSGNLINQAIPPTPLAQQTSYTNNAVYGTALSGTGNSKAGIKVNAGSTLIGKTVNTIEFPIIRSGSPTGTYYAEVYASDGSTLKYTFGSGDIVILSSSAVTWKTFTNTASSYTIAAGDKIVMRFSGGTHATNDLSLKYAESPSGSYDGTNTTFCYGNTCQNELTDADASFKLWHTGSP